MDSQLRTIFLTVFIGTLTVFTGCAVGPRYVKPSVVVPADYKENKGWKVAEPKDGITRGSWWKVFNDPQLNALEDQVDISNQNIALAQAQFEQARALVQAARAGYFPVLAAGGSVTRSKINPGVLNTNYLLNGDASWQLDLWGKLRRTVEASRASAQASAADLETTRLSIQAELAQDYFQLCAADTQQKIFVETIGIYKTFLQLTKNRYDSGVASRSDLLQAQTQLESAQAQDIDIGVQRAQLEHAIAILIGKSPSEFSLPVTELTTIIPSLPVGLPSRLLERRPDIAANERLMAAANAQIGVAEAAFFPSLTLSASGSYPGTSLSDLFSSPNPLWSIGPALLQTFLDGGLRIAQKKEAQEAYAVTVAAYRQSVLTAFGEVEDNLAALRILEQEAQIQGQSVNDAHQAVVLLTDQYKAGTATTLEVIVAQATELANKNSAVNILSRRMVACVLLIKALGGGWELSALQSN